MLVMEYCEMGQMDKWLVQNKANMTEQVMENLFRFCLGIAKGMEYLASKKVGAYSHTGYFAIPTDDDDNDDDDDDDDDDDGGGGGSSGGGGGSSISSSSSSSKMTMIMRRNANL